MEQAATVHLLTHTRTMRQAYLLRTVKEVHLVTQLDLPGGGGGGGGAAPLKGRV